MRFTRQPLQPGQRWPIAQQPAVDLLQTAQAATEILIATVTVHVLGQLTRRDSPCKVDVGTRPHGSASSPLSAPAQTTSHTHVARAALAASSAAKQTSPSPTTCCRTTRGPRATPRAPRRAVPVPSLPRPESTVRRDAPPTD